MLIVCFRSMEFEHGDVHKTKIIHITEMRVLFYICYILQCLQREKFQNIHCIESAVLFVCTLCDYPLINK